MLPKMCIIFTVATAALLVGSHSAAALCGSCASCNDNTWDNNWFKQCGVVTGKQVLGVSKGLEMIGVWGLEAGQAGYHWCCCYCPANVITGMCVGNTPTGVDNNYQMITTDVDCSKESTNTVNKGASPYFVKSFETIALEKASPNQYTWHRDRQHVTGSTVGECCEPPPITGMCTGNTGGTGDVNCAGQFWINGRTRNKGASVAGSTVGACCEAPPITGMCMGNTGGTGDVNCLNEATNTVNKGASVAGSTVGACCEPAPCIGYAGWGSGHYSAYTSPCDRDKFIAKLKPGEGYYWSTYPNDRTNGRTVLTGGWCTSISPEGVTALTQQYLRTVLNVAMNYGGGDWVHFGGRHESVGMTYFPPTSTTTCVPPANGALFLKAGDEEEAEAAQLPFANVVDADPTAATTTTNTQPTPAKVARTVFAGIIAACGLYVVWVVARKTPPSNSNKDVLDAPENMGEISEI